MPDFVKTAELRKGPINQRTLTWMNEVQSHFCKNRVWVRDRSVFYIRNFTIGWRYRADISRICKEEEQADVPMKAIGRYIEEDLQPAIDALVWTEKSRQRAIQDEAGEVTAAKKRKREEDQEANKKLKTIIDELHTLRESVDGKIGKMNVGIRRKFLKLESSILDRIVASDSEEDTVDNDNNNDNDD